MKKKFVIIDVDDVILDTLSLVILYFNKLTEKNYTRDLINTWDFYLWPWVKNEDIEVDEFIKGFREILRGYIPLKYYAKEGLNYLSKIYDIILLTQRKNITFAPLKDNLKKFYKIDYPLYNAIWHKEGKKYFILDFLKDQELAYFIDDGPHNLESVFSIKKRNFKVVKFNMPYNKIIKSDLSFNNWLDFILYLKQIH